ncbi:MazG-like family protein [Kitasatospora sp. NBC_01287]|uniref:MazG-like family protein n=1 Tax=Kitasatospora sp. NBC_01287 TaxID=2903573 RepID=UPI00224E8488|nr:MazG-like family protein [Kitasatospora sp. NBC_01287]MCX4744794.1 MazG-like family protein [Kitasatospora sp. NBC_01287]
MDEIWETVNFLADKLDSHFDRSDEQRWTVQALKLQEEVGEVAEAVIGALGANPRKGHSHDWDDVRKETCDVALSALVLLARMGGDPRRFFAEHLRAVAARSESGGTTT